jgi:UDP-glucuronate decarboxylase
MSAGRGKKILITGGAGFLGSHLCEKLLKQGHFVYCLDNFVTGDFQNISSLSSHPSFTLMKQDVCDPIDLDIDEIFNLASAASPIHYQRFPIITVKSNVLGSLNMLELAKAKGARIFQASTSEVYGDPQVHPQTEQYLGSVNPIGPRACYDEGKRCAETLFFDFYRTENVPVKVARIFNTYGPRMHPEDGRVVSNFIVQALLKKPLTIYGDGTQTRSFCFVDDLIRGILLMMDKDNLFPGPINLGNPVEFTILELAELVLELTNSDSKLIFKPLPSDDPKQRKPDITRAKKELNWTPSVGLKEGLKQTVAYFDEIVAKQKEPLSIMKLAE